PAALHGHGNVIGDGSVARVHLALLLREAPLEGGERRVERRVALLHQLDQLGDARRGQVERIGMVDQEIEPGERARIVLRSEEERQHELVDVLDLVVAGANRLLRAHEGGHVTAHAHAVLVRALGGLSHPFGVEGVVDLDLAVAVPGRSEEHTSELQSLAYLVCRLLLEKKKRLRYRRVRSACGKLYCATYLYCL